MTTPTLSQLGEMTDEELNVRLARLAGWRTSANHGEIGGYTATSPKGDTNYYASGPTEIHAILASCPDYCRDANAVAEVRKGMTEEQRHWFSFNLQRLLGFDLTNFERHYQQCFEIADAPPRLHTIALVRTLGTIGTLTP